MEWLKDLIEYLAAAGFVFGAVVPCLFSPGFGFPYDGDRIPGLYSRRRSTYRGRLVNEVSIHAVLIGIGFAAAAVQMGPFSTSQGLVFAAIVAGPWVILRSFYGAVVLVNRRLPSFKIGT